MFFLVALATPTVFCTPVLDSGVQTQVTSPLQNSDENLQQLYDRLQNFINPSNSYAYQLWNANYSTGDKADEICREKLEELRGVPTDAPNGDCLLQLICTKDHSRFPFLLITGRCYGNDSDGSETQTTACGEFGFDSCRPLEQIITILIKSDPILNSTAEEWRLGLQNIVTGCQCV